jgi:hypothetical protein
MALKESIPDSPRFMGFDNSKVLVPGHVPTKGLDIFFLSQVFFFFLSFEFSPFRCVRREENRSY